MSRGLTDFRHARRMLKAHAPMADVVAFYAGRYTEAEIKAGVSELRARKSLYNRYEGPSPSQLRLLDRAPAHKPARLAALFADRDRRLSLECADLTGRLMNDPPLQLSALKKREAWKPRDPLAHLVSPFHRRRAPQHAGATS